MIRFGLCGEVLVPDSLPSWEEHTIASRTISGVAPGWSER